MEGKNKILFAYPVAYKEEMTKEDMCIPSPFFTGFEPDSVQTIVITVGYSISYVRRAYLLVNVNRVGDPKNYENITEDGKAETLKGSFFFNNMAVFLTSFFLNDFEVKDSGYYEIEVTLFEADEHGKKTDNIIDRHSSEFFVQVKEKQQ